jgi:hypothetical protein
MKINGQTKSHRSGGTEVPASREQARPAHTIGRLAPRPPSAFARLRRDRRPRVDLLTARSFGLRPFALRKDEPAEKLLEPIKL